MRRVMAEVDGLDVVAISSVFALFFGLCVVFGFGIALIVHGVLGLVFVFGSELLIKPSLQRGD
ncbi:hypothetical protein [Streptosporangium sp. KLBMP 9127]|nr:hypothetical protein [Streptosporangium sp. KLBMP 9127]